MTVTNIYQAAQSLKDDWAPRVVARVNECYVKVAKLSGQLAWHAHHDEDELFLVIRGRLTIEYEAEKSVSLNPGDVHVVSRGTLHNPVAEDDCLILLIEPVSTKHTGDVQTNHTRTIQEQLAGASTPDEGAVSPIES